MMLGVQGREWREAFFEGQEAGRHMATRQIERVQRVMRHFILKWGNSAFRVPLFCYPR
jgi:hypothetical protein